MAVLRRALLEAVDEDTLVKVIAAMIDKASEGDVAAARLILERCLGSPEALDAMIRVEELERRLDAFDREVAA